MKSDSRSGATSTASVIGTSVLLALFSCGTLSLTGCVIAGVSSGGGSFIWPGSIELLVLIMIAVFVLRRR
jgi:4-hydroxybenzoate polyprenyltransferase